MQVRVLPGSTFYSSDLIPELLDHGVVGVLVGHVEGSVYGTAVGILHKKNNLIAKKINRSNGWRVFMLP